jgi:two-component system CheB/CheR fusion protein
MIGLVDADLRLEISNRAFERMGLTDEELQGAPLSNVLGSETTRAVADRMAQQAGQSFEIEAPIALPAQGERTFLVHCAPRKIEGKPSGHYLAAIDIHDRKMWEERTRVISDELDHRVKNILALVNTIARMTGRSAETIEGFREVFASRIASLSRTHSALAASDWTGMDLTTLVNNELEAYAGDALQQFEIAGPRVDLSMRASQSLALAIHELTTNAVKHGALSNAAGHLSVTWSMEQSVLRLDWHETGLKKLAVPDRVGFGSNVVRNAVERQLHGTLKTDFRPDGLRCTITVPGRMLSDKDTRHE